MEPPRSCVTHCSMMLCVRAVPLTQPRPRGLCTKVVCVSTGATSARVSARLRAYLQEVRCGSGCWWVGGWQGVGFGSPLECGAAGRGGGEGFVRVEGLEGDLVAWVSVGAGWSPRRGRGSAAHRTRCISSHNVVRGLACFWRRATGASSPLFPPQHINTQRCASQRTGGVRLAHGG